MDESEKLLKIKPEFNEITEIVNEYFPIGNSRIFALKFNFNNFSIKDIPARNIILNHLGRDLKEGSVIFEASSGNFGIALAKFGKVYGFKVVILISRKVNKNVINALEKNGATVILLNTEICPIPGKEDIAYESQAKESLKILKNGLEKIGLDTKIIDINSKEIINLLKKQNTIELAKYLAKIYNGFCPMQYENELNPMAHYNYTAKIIEEKIMENNVDLSKLKIICTFGTGGTSYGISKYFLDRYNRKIVTVAFPEEGQDVGGIRNLGNAHFLPFFKPELYESIEKVNFYEAKKIMEFFINKGESIGESSALALQCCLDLIKKESKEKVYVVIFADDAQKYSGIENKNANIEITFNEARNEYFDYIVWVLSVPLKQSGKEYLSRMFNIEKEKIIDEEDLERLNIKKGKILFLCLSGITSLQKAESLNKENSDDLEIRSLKGGINSIIKNTKGISLKDFLEF